MAVFGDNPARLGGDPPRPHLELKERPTANDQVGSRTEARLLKGSGGGVIFRADCFRSVSEKTLAKMKIPRLPSLLLCAGVAFAMTNALSSAESTEDAYLRELEEHSAATREIEALIRSGKLKEAENAVLLSEPKYARKWSLGRFGYGARMEIGQAYLDRGDVAEALRLFQSAKPGGGCGNCMASQHVQRNIRVARIYESRLNFPAAFASYLGALPGTSLGGGLGSVFFGLLKSGGICGVPILALVYFVRRRQKRGKKRTEGQGAAPNGSPATPLEDSGATNGPPSVS